MDAVQVCDVNTADNTNAIIFQMRLTQGDILPDNMTGFYWILIGKAQQWGYITESSSSADYRYFPVPFVTEYYAICTGSSQRQDNVAVWLNQIDTLKFLAGIGENYTAMPQKNIFYFACGRQQWGYGGDSNLVTFPTAFNISCFSVLAIAASGVPQGAGNITNTGFTVKGYNGTGFGAYWIAAGK